MSLYEELRDNRGEKYRRPLGTATWVQTPDRTIEQYRLSSIPAHSEHRGPGDAQWRQPADRPGEVPGVLSCHACSLQGPPAEELLLYYGNPQAVAPHYDLSLVAGQLIGGGSRRGRPGRRRKA